jgi:uncharacterized lipoprotein YmbA
MVSQASGASEDEPLMISQRLEAQLGQTQKGTWVAAGAINDEGDATITTSVVTPDADDGEASVTATHVLTSRGDSAQMIELSSQTRLRPFPPPPPKGRVMVEGRWRLVAGTKAYANLRARGKLYATITDRLVKGKPGREITLVRDGSASRGS